MPNAFLCHAAADESAARALAAWLERNSSCTVRLAECGEAPAVDLVEAAEQAMSADAVVLLLSPASVPRPWPPRTRWEPVLLEGPVEAGVGLACVLLEECQVPGLLRRRAFFPDSLEGRRGLKRWLLGLFPRVVALPGASPAAASVEDVEALRRAVADEPGEALDVPVDAARTLVQHAQDEFEGVFWIDGAGRTPAGVYGDLAEAAGLSLAGTAEENAAHLSGFCAARRILVVLDDCVHAPFERAGKCSLVRTAPHPRPAPWTLDELRPLFAAWTARSEECLARLRDVPAALCEAPWESARGTAYAAAALLRHRGRVAELLELTEAVLPLALAAGDDAAARHFDWERTWILQAWGRPEALTAPIVPPTPGAQLTLPFAAA